MYIKRGQFGKFVADIIKKNNDEQTAEAEKEDEQKLWLMYVHSMSGKSFIEWKKEVLKNSGSSQGGADADMSEDDIESIINSLFPKK